MKADKIVYQGSDYFHYDGLGSTVNLTNEYGSVTMTYEYDAFGAVKREENGIGWKKNQYKFGGGYGVSHDPAAGLHYMLNRWYDPRIGRFITKDPILEPIINLSPFQEQPSITFNVREDPLISLPAIISKLKLKRIWFLLSVIDEPLRFHPYIYCANNPINYIDPTGLGEDPFVGWDYHRCYKRCIYLEKKRECKEKVGIGRKIYCFFGCVFLRKPPELKGKPGFGFPPPTKNR
ncbi:MAG: RHS repeat-associated core domain-containing protein [bacterium]